MNRAMIIITNQAERDKATRWAQGVSVGTRIEFKEPKRTLPQNDRFWAMLTDIAEAMKERGREYAPDQWKVIFMTAYGHEVKFLPSLDMKTFIPVGHSSSDLSVREMSDLMEFMSAWAAENGITLNDHKSPDGEAAGSPSDAAPADADSSSPASDSEAGEVSPPVASPASTLVRYARDIFAIALNAGSTGGSPDVIRKVNGTWANDITKLTEEDREKAKAIAKSANSIFNDPARFEGVIEYYAEMMGCQPGDLMERTDA